MKRICKKFITSLLIVVMVINFILNPFSFAGAGIVRDTIVFLLGTFIGVLSWLPRVFAIAVGYAIDWLAGMVAYLDGATAGNDVKAFVTPFDVVFNKLAITDIDFFDFEGVDADSTVYKIREAVAGWYYFVRLIAVAVLLVILVYVGIRMALSTIAEDKAKYKKMLVDWVASLALVFLMEYIVVFLISLNHVIVDAMYGLMGGDDTSEGLATAMGDLALTALSPFIDGIGATIVFFLFVFQTFSVLFSYINRMIRCAFLIIIAPLITITYSIDKMGDGKAQALNTWLKEFLTAVLIQPFHCVIYMVFISTAIKLLQEADINSALASSVIAILCMLFINDAEKIVRKIFALDGDDGASSIAAGAALAGAALHKSKDIGKVARKGTNMLKEMKPIQNTKKAINTVKDGTKATFKTVGDALSGKGGPGFSENYNMAKANREVKQEEKQKQKDLNTYKKRSKEFTKEDQKEIYNRKLELMKQNPGMSGAEARRQAIIETTQKKRQRGDFQPKVIKGARSVASKVGHGYRTFRQSNLGQYVGKSFQRGVGIAVGGMLAGKEDMFTAFAGGVAAKNSVAEYMNSSNSYIAEEASEYARGAGITSKEEIEQVYQETVSGKSESNVKKSEENFEARVKNAGITDSNGNQLDESQINDIMNKIEMGITKKPEADPTELMANALGKSVADLESQMDVELSKALDGLKNAVNRMNLGNSIQKGTEYGASVSTLAGKTASYAQQDRITLGDEDIVDKLYQNDSLVRHKVLTEEQVENNIVRNLTNTGIDLSQYLVQLKRERSAMGTDEKSLYGSNLDQNINTIEEYLRKQSRNNP